MSISVGPQSLESDRLYARASPPLTLVWSFGNRKATRRKGPAEAGPSHNRSERPVTDDDQAYPSLAGGVYSRPRGPRPSVRTKIQNRIRSRTPSNCSRSHKSVRIGGSPRGVRGGAVMRGPVGFTKPRWSALGSAGMVHRETRRGSRRDHEAAGHRALLR
jgi:hypothetical protein